MAGYIDLKNVIKKMARAKEFEEWPEKNPYSPPQRSFTNRIKGAISGS
jgi:hypothetical protein